MSNPAYQWLVQQSKPANRWLFLSIALGSFSVFLIILQAGILSYCIDQLYIHHAGLHALQVWLIILVVTIASRSVLVILRERTSFQAAKIVKENVRRQLINKLMSSSLTELSQAKTGSLTSVLLEHIEALQGFYADYFPHLSITVFALIFIVITVFSQNWIAGLILLFSAPLIILFMALIGMGVAGLNQRHFKLLAHMSAQFLDTLQGLTTLTLFHRAHEQTEKIDDVSQAYRKRTMEILRIAFLSSATLELFSTISIAIIAVYLGLGLLGFIQVGFGGVHISLQQALFILLLAPEFFLPLRQLGVFYHARAEALGAADEIIKITENTTDISSHNMQPFSDPHPSLSLEKITFGYTSDHNVITDFSLVIPFGACIAVTGPSGSGKSTVLKLIAKLIAPTAGDIEVNTLSLQNIDQDEWLAHIAFLHQHPRLFHGTILDNIRFAKPTADDKAVFAAADEAGVTAFTTTFSNGFKTLVGEQNTGISGGQTQRVALARIILKNAPIVLLDEPTAHLDDETADIIIALLKKWRGNKTVIVATHDERFLRMAEVTERVSL